MPNINDLKRDIDLHDLADKLGLVRPDPRGNYKSPHHEDKSPSLSVFGDDRLWKDFSDDDAGGSCIDLVMYVEGMTDVGDAVKRLHDLYGWPLDKPELDEAPKKRTKIEWFAELALKTPERCIDYLVDERKLKREVVEHCIKRGTVGFTDYTNTKLQSGQVHYGGDAVAFISYQLHTRRAVRIDYRYFNPAINGDMKTKSVGDKQGVLWVPDFHQLKDAHTVVIVESAINALSVLSAGKVGVAAVAMSGTQNTDIDWRFLRGKRVILGMDNDKPNDKGYRPGAKAAWRVHEQLNALEIPCLFLDQDTDEWDDINDLNDYLKAHGEQKLGFALERFEQWLIPGMNGGDKWSGSKRRIVLPEHDFSKYWQFRCKADFTTFVKEVTEKDENGNTTGTKLVYDDLCGFRVSVVSRVAIASAHATMTGEVDTSPKTIFSASVQVPRHKNKLVRRVFDDEELHNIDRWRKFGPIYKPAQFSRMLNIWERATDIGARNAVNFVGLAWRDSKLTVNEGADCFFTDPEKQCPYHNLSFPSGAQTDAARVIAAYQATMKTNVATQLLCWGLGAHLKAFLGFWPHSVLQAEKGAGKSVLSKSLENTMGFTMFSGQSLQTEFRVLTSLSHTSHPVGWEELSARKQDVIDKAVAMLQESYNYTVTRRGSDMTDYLLSAPVFLAGEDVPVNSLLGKLVRVSLTQDKKGDLLPKNLPKFPVRQWLEWLAVLPANRVHEKYAIAERYMLEHSAAAGTDGGAGRIVGNYAAVSVAWSLLCEFSGIAITTGGFIGDLVTEMNRHLIDSVGDRRPWVALLEVLLGQLDAKTFPFPYKFDKDDNDEDVLYIRTTHIMQHLSQNTATRAKFDASPVKSSKVLLKQLKEAGVVMDTDKEKRFDGKRVAHMQVLSLKVMEEYGLAPALPEVFTSN